MLSHSGFLVPVAGLEPARCRQRWILSPLRLPIPSHRQVCFKLYNHSSRGSMESTTSSCCGAQNFLLAIRSRNFDRCHSLASLDSATGGGRLAPQFHHTGNWYCGIIHHPFENIKWFFTYIFAAVLFF